MADEKIKKSDIIEDGILDEAISSGEKYNTILTEQNKLLKENAKLYKDVASNAKLTAKGIKDVDKAESETIKLQKEAERVTREKIKNESELEKLKQAKIRTTQAEIRLGQQQQKIRDRNNKALQQESSAYKRLSKRLNETRARYKDLLAEGRGTEKQTRKLGKEVELLDKKLKSIDAAAGQFQRNVGNYPKTLSKVSASFRQLIGLIGQFGIALGGVAIARDAFSVILDFDQALANLKAISGATTQEMKALENQAKQLGSTTSFTASEVAGLQTEFAKLGFSVREIQAATESTLQLSKATGADLAQAAKLSGSAMKAFNLDASEAARVNSVLGVATTKTALDFEQLRTGLSTVAPVASAAGFSIEETTALLGQLSNAGFDASSGATATRNIILNLVDANGKLAKSLGRPIKGVKDLAPALAELNDKLGEDGLAEALELTDKRSVAAFQTFLKGADDLEPLVASLTDVEDELANIAETQDNTLRGSIDRLRSAWEGYILGTDGATGASEKLRKIIDFLAKNLDTIINTVINLGRVFITFKTTLFLTNKVIIPLTKGIKQMGAAFVSSGTGIKGATSAFKSFNSALKANVISFVVVGIVELVNYLRVLEDDLERVANNVLSIGDAIQKQKEVQSKKDQEFINGRVKSLQSEIKALKDKAEIEIASNPNKEKEIQARLQNDINQLYNQEYAELVRLKALQDRRIKSTEEEITQNKGLIESLKIQKQILESRGGIDNIKNAFAIQDEINALLDDNYDLNQKIVSFEQIKKDLSAQIKIILGEQEDVSKGITIEKLKQLNFDKKRLSIAKEELNDLDKAKKRLKEILKERENLIRLEEGGILSIEDEAKFQSLTNKIEQLKAQIDNADAFLEVEQLTKLEPIIGEFPDNEPLKSSLGLGEAKDEAEKNAEEIEDIYKQLGAVIKSIYDQILEAIKESIDKQIELLDKQINASKDRQDQLRDIAINGRGEIAEDAKRSLAQEEAKAAQAEAKKAQLEKRKQVLEQTTIILNNIGNLVEQGLSIDQATAQSFAAFEIVKQLLGGLSAFYEGTDDTGKASNPLDNKGGRLAVLHDNEQVWSKKDREKVGFKSRDEVIQAAQDGWRLASEIGNYQSMLTDLNGVRPMTEIAQVNAFDTTELQSEIRDVKEAIKNMKFPHSEAGKITSEFFRWMSNDGRGNVIQHTIKKPKL